MSLPRMPNITLGTVLRSVGVILLIVLIVLYVQFQSRNFIQGPTISLLNEPEQVQNTREIVLEGETKNITKLTLNGKEITTDELGNFNQTVFLENGYTIVTIYAEDRFGRSTAVIREYVYVENE